jgi:polysaccharide export outer membrane protein
MSLLTFARLHMPLARPSILALLLLAVSVTGCANRPPHRTEELQAAYTGPYRLDSGDQVRLTVFGQDDLTRVYPVDVGGGITMPLIGGVPARGRTTDDLARDVAVRLSRNYVRNPDVSVEVQTYRPFFVLGEVQRAGQFPYVSGMTAQTAIAIAGGYTYRADRRGVTITRQLGDRMIRGYAPLETPIMPGDTINVDERLF